MSDSLVESLFVELVLKGYEIQILRQGNWEPVWFDINLMKDGEVLLSAYGCTSVAEGLSRLLSLA